MRKESSIDPHDLDIKNCIRCLEKIARKDRASGNNGRASSLNRAILQLKMAQRVR